MLIYLGPLGRFMSNNVGHEVGTQSIETVKLRFFSIFVGVTFLRLMFFIQYLNAFVKQSVISFQHSICDSLLHFHSQLVGLNCRFRGKKRDIKNTKLDAKTMKGVVMY